jgi:hypothetical protein
VVPGHVSKHQVSQSCQGNDIVCTQGSFAWGSHMKRALLFDAPVMVHGTCTTGSCCDAGGGAVCGACSFTHSPRVQHPLVAA